MRRAGIDAITAAMDVAKPVVYAIELDGIPRAALTTREFAAITGQTINHVLREINEGRIRVTRGGGHGKPHVIPVSEVARYVDSADYLDPTA